MEDDDDDENVNGDIGSPSPPFEGIIKEEAEKQLESQGGGLLNNLENEVITFAYYTASHPPYFSEFIIFEP